MPLSWALVRITVGLMIIPHGWAKLMMGIQATANMALVKRGIETARRRTLLARSRHW